MDEQQILPYIIKCIEESGSDPRSQIIGYINSGNVLYITRKGNARELIKSIDSATLEQYVAKKHAQ